MLIDRIKDPKWIRTAFAAVLALSLAACAESTGPASNEKTPEPTAMSATEEPEASPSASAEEHPADISERAMDNLAGKLKAGNYVSDAEGFLKLSVVSPELVIFSYEEDAYDDIALITLDHETFEGVLTDDGLIDPVYISDEDAMTVAANTIPSNWVGISGGNMFELFYNNVEKPLEFVSNDDNVKMTLIRMAGYGASALNLMHEVYMTLDAEDPSSVRFTAEVDDNVVARIFYDDLDLTLTFGNAESDPRADAWIASPSYPAAETEWSEDDLFFLNSVFLPGYGKDALPFPDFASYAMQIDEGVFADKMSIRLTDAHGTEADVEHYIDLLKEDGFTEAEQETEDGGTVTVFRKLLRPEYDSYASAYPHYEDGFVLEAGRYYETPVYDELAAINEVIGTKGYAPLEENDHLSGWSAVDNRAERTESWLYFFEYDLSMFVDVKYDDEDEVKAYLEEYGEKLAENGFTPVYTFDGEKDVLDYYESVNGSGVFRYQFAEDGETLSMQFRHEKEISAEEAIKLIGDAGIPELPLHGNLSCRNITPYHRMVRDFKGQLFLTVSQPFGSAQDAERFLDDYVSVLDDAGYYRTNPEMVGSMRENAYYNEEEDKIVAFDFFPEEDSAVINFEFVANR